MTEEAQVRRLRGGDGRVWRDAVAALLSDAVDPNELISPGDVEAALDDDRCYLIVAGSNASPVGLLSAYRFPDLAEGGCLVYLYDIEVEQGHRQRGVGTGMLETLMACCAADDVHTIWAGTDRENEAARRLFRKTGAELAGSSYVEYEWKLQY